MLKDPKLAQKLAFYGVFYLILAAVVAGGWVAKDYVRPLAVLFVPINDKPFAYSFLVLTAMYWGMVVMAETVFKKKS